MKAEEAREALDKAIGQLLVLPSHDQPPLLSGRSAVMAAADAYGDARELQGHVGACDETEFGLRCGQVAQTGNHWHCPRGKELTHETPLV